MNHQKISVIAPCLNEEKYLPSFLNSLIHQTFRNFEVIIVDGGSTDHSLMILQKYSNKLDMKIIVDYTRNFGYIRNVGSSIAKGEILLEVNTDNYLPPKLLAHLYDLFMEHPETLSISGRIYPLGTSIIAKIAYPAFDFLRFIFTCLPNPIKKYRPSGNFTAVRAKTFREIGGYPEVAVNEDGLFGQKLDVYCKKNPKAVMFTLKLWIGHYVKKFEEMGGFKALLFYFYTFTNFFPMTKRLLEPIRKNAELVFKGLKNC